MSETMATALQTVVLGVNLLTGHFGSEQASERETVTPGLYARTPDGWTAGVYRNSGGRLSVLGGWTWMTADGRWALTVGAVSGYDQRAISPLVVPSVRFDLGEGVALRVAALPKRRAESAAGVHLSIERAW